MFAKEIKKIIFEFPALFFLNLSFISVKIKCLKLETDGASKQKKNNSMRKKEIWDTTSHSLSFKCQSEAGTH